MVLSIFDSEIGSTFAKNNENMAKEKAEEKGERGEASNFLL